MSYANERTFDKDPAVRRGEGYTVSDIAEVRHRLVLVEEQVIRLIEDSAATNAMAAMADRDVAAYRQEMRAHIRVINALRETQLEQGQVLAGHTRELGALREALGALREAQVEQGRELAEHRRILDEHTAILHALTAILNEHGRALEQHTVMLSEHGRALEQHTVMLSEQGTALTSLVAGQTAVMGRLDRVLGHLGVNEHGDGDPSQN